MRDNSKFVNVVVGAKQQLEFDPTFIVEKVSNLAKLEMDQKTLEEKARSLNKERQFLEQKCSILEQGELVHAHRISIYEELEKMGMGIKELKLLRHTVAEIATANKISEDKAVQRFFSDLEQQYDYMLGFESKIQNLKSEIEKNEHMRLQFANFTAMLNYLIMWQFDQIQSVSGFVEFGPLGKAAKGEKVPKNQLKNAIIKAIDIFIDSDPTDRSTGTLQITKRVLQNDIQASDAIAPSWSYTQQHPPQQSEIQESDIIAPSQTEIQDIY